MSDKMTDTIARLKKTVSRFDWRTILKPTGDLPVDDKVAKELDNYFECFAENPAGDGKPCISCEKPLAGLLTFLTGGGFEWGLQHGEGRCSACGWPARAHHRIGGILTINNFVLQYHPDYVSQIAKETDR